MFPPCLPIKSVGKQNGETNWGNRMPSGVKKARYIYIRAHVQLINNTENKKYENNQ